MLKDLIDEDEFCVKVMGGKSEEPRVSFYGLFYELVMDPSPQIMEALLSNYTMVDVVNGLKHLIKFKFSRLSDDVAVNVVLVVKMMLGYGENVDTLVVNLLRHHLVNEVYQMYKENPRYFDDHPHCLTFLAFSCSQNACIKNIPSDQCFRDFLFPDVKEKWGNLYSDEHRRKRGAGDALVNEYPSFPLSSHFSFHELSTLFTSTPLNILSFQLSVELEMNVVFILENDQNFDFHMSLLFSDHIRSSDDACRVMRFISNIPHPLRIGKLVESILERYPDSFVAFVYDLLFWNQNDSLNRNVMEYLKGKNECVVRLISLQDDWEVLRMVMRKQKSSVENVIRMIHNLNFSRYYEMIKEMEKWNSPIIPREIYNGIVVESFGWDGYAQVYLWKILGFQKIHLGLDVDRVTEGSPEALEGYEIVSNLIGRRSDY